MGRHRLHHVRWSDGSLDPLYQQLVATKWLRVGSVTAFGMLQLWMTARALPSQRHDDAARVGRTAPAA